MPPTVENDPAQLLQPLPVRDATRQVGDFAAARRAEAGNAARPAAVPRFSVSVRPAPIVPAVPPVRPQAGPSSLAPSSAPTTTAPAAPELKAPGTVLDRRPAQIAIAEGYSVPEQLFRLFNEARGRTEVGNVSARILRLNRIEPLEMAAPAAAGRELREGSAADAPGVQTANLTPVRDIPELTPAPAKAGILEAAEAGDDIQRTRAREVFAAAIHDRLALQKGGIGTGGIRQILIDETV